MNIRKKIAVLALGAILIMAASPVCAADEIMFSADAGAGAAGAASLIRDHASVDHQCADADSDSEPSAFPPDSNSAAEPNCCLNEDHFLKAIGEPKSDALDSLPMTSILPFSPDILRFESMGISQAEADESPPAVPLETIVKRE